MPSTFSKPVGELEIGGEIRPTAQQTWTVAGAEYTDWAAARKAGLASAYIRRAGYIEGCLRRGAGSGSADELVAIGWDSFTRRELHAEQRALRERAAAALEEAHEAQVQASIAAHEQSLLEH